MNNMSLNHLNIIRDIFLGHHTTRSRTSVFHADLPAIQHALALHGIHHHDMPLIDCRHALIHHIITGAFVLIIQPTQGTYLLHLLGLNLGLAEQYPKDICQRLTSPKRH